jgi:hypothetical protein
MNDVINVIADEVVPSEGFIENFDGEAFPPINWRMDTPGHAWEHAYDLQDETNGVAQFPNYWVNTNGAEDMLITPGFNPTLIENFSFDYAHMQYSSYVDGLEVWVRLSGEEEWSLVWEQYGADLSVEGCYTWFWYDTVGDVAWENVTIVTPDHWATSGATCGEIAFVNVGGYGNHTWIDNVVVGSPGNAGCPEDVDNDGFVTVNDVLAVLSEFGCTVGCSYDLNLDGIVGVLDILDILAAFGNEC